MKKIIAIIGVFALAYLVFESCNPKKTDSHVVLTGLVSYASLKDSSLTQDQRNVLRQLSKRDSSNLSKYLKNNGDTISYNKSRTPGKEGNYTAEVFPINSAFAAAASNGKMADLCPCPGNTGMCPCPATTTNILFTTQATDVKVYDNTTPLEPEDLDGRVDVGWKSYKLKNLDDRTFTLKIEGNFGDTGFRKYEIQMEIKDGKLSVVR